MKSRTLTPEMLEKMKSIKFDHKISGEWLKELTFGVPFPPPVPLVHAFGIIRQDNLISDAERMALHFMNHPPGSHIHYVHEFKNGSQILMPSPKFLNDAKTACAIRLNNLIIDDWSFIRPPKHITRKQRLKQKKLYRRRYEKFQAQAEALRLKLGAPKEDYLFHED